MENISQLQGPLVKLINQFHDENQAFRKVHRLIDAFEWAIKWHTIIAVSDLMRESNIEPKIKVLFSAGS